MVLFHNFIFKLLINDICMLILFFITLLQSLFISSRRYFFFVDYLEFSTLTIMPSANKNSFTSSYLINIPLIYFSCLISLVKTLNKNDERRYLCLVTFLRGGNVLSLNVKYEVSCGFLCV